MNIGSWFQSLFGEETKQQDTDPVQEVMNEIKEEVNMPEEEIDDNYEEDTLVEDEEIYEEELIA